MIVGTVRRRCSIVHSQLTSRPVSSIHMSKRNGDRARFHKERRRKMLRRQRIHALVKALARDREKGVASPVTGGA